MDGDFVRYQRLDLRLRPRVTLSRLSQRVALAGALGRRRGSQSGDPIDKKLLFFPFPTRSTARPGIEGVYRYGALVLAGVAGTFKGTGALSDGREMPTFVLGPAVTRPQKNEPA